MALYNVIMDEWTLKVILKLLDDAGLNKTYLVVDGKDVHDETYGAIADSIEENKYILRGGRDGSKKERLG